jgi:hypothetical protein
MVMNQLRDYITERIRIDNIKILKFPIDGTLQDIVEFLEDAGFKKVSTSANWANSFEKYKKYNTRCYALEHGTATYIEIIDRTNSKFKNKLFYIKLHEDDKYYNIFDDITTAKMALDARQVSKEEFLAELSVIF